MCSPVSSSLRNDEPDCGSDWVPQQWSQPLSPADKAAIDAALLARHVVVFPEQGLSREAQFAFAANFGEVERHGAHRPGAENKRYAVAHVMSNLGPDGRPAVRLERRGRARST